MNTIEELLNSNKGEKPKETILEKAIIKNQERKERKLEEDYKELSQLENKLWLKILTFACPFIGTMLGVVWSLFSLGIEEEYLKIIGGLLISTVIGNIIGGILSAIITNAELQRTEIDMYNGMKTKHLKSDYEKDQAIKDRDKAQNDYKKLFDETTQLRKEYEERKIQEEVNRRFKAKEAEINSLVEKRIEEEVQKRLNECPMNENKI
jgi:hypothetical protein